jgi:hypothetical protein
MKLWEFMIKHYAFRTEKQCEEYCDMMLVTVNGVASQNHELLLFHRDYVSVIKEVMPIDGYDEGRERLGEILESAKVSEEMPELDITPERLEEDRLKQDPSPESCGGLSGTHYDYDYTSWMRPWEDDDDLK